MLTLLPLLLLVASSAHGGITAKTASVASVEVGTDFKYFISYNCPSSLGSDCTNVDIIDVLPPNIQYRGHFTNTHTAGATINTPGVGNGGTISFTSMAVPSGDSGILEITVRFTPGTTLNGDTADNQAESTNLGTPTQSNVVTVTAIATETATLTKGVQSDSFFDKDITYTLTTTIPATGALNLSGVTVTDDLPDEAVYQSATPAPDSCTPTDCTTPGAILTWTGRTAAVGSPLVITITVRYPDPNPVGAGDTLPVTNAFAVSGTHEGGAPGNYTSPGINHTIEEWVPEPGLSLSKYETNPATPTVGQAFQYIIRPDNNGNVPVENMVMEDALPAEFLISGVTTGSYSGVADYGGGVGVQVQYQLNDSGTWEDWGSSSAVENNESLTIPGGVTASEITDVRWLYGTASTSFNATTSPLLNGSIPSATPGLTTVKNCAAVTATYTGEPNPTASNCETFTVAGDFVLLRPDKSRNSSTTGNKNPGDTIKWDLTVSLDRYSSRNLPINDLVVVDLLPIDLSYDTDDTSWSGNGFGINYGSSGLSIPPNLEVIPNYDNTGLTLLRWTWSSGETVTPDRIQAHKNFTITFTTTVREGAYGGSQNNTFGATVNTGGYDLRCSHNSRDDIQDLDNDGADNDTLCTNSGSDTIVSSALLTSAMTVQGICDAGFGTEAGTLSGASYDYKLTVTNEGTVPMKNFTVVDILPFVDDTGVVNWGENRDSAWRPLLVTPIVGPPGGTVYYSTSDNPCRDDVINPPNSPLDCEDPHWSTVPPSPISSTQSFKLEFGDRELAPFDSLNFVFTMVTPFNNGFTADETANNSFGYLGWRSDEPTAPPIGSEPPMSKVAYGNCSASSLGNVVWVDTNRDGVQNENGTGINDVQLTLYTPGADTVQGTFDDINLGTTITANDASEQPGWYAFPGLAPGEYYVCADVPATFVATLTNQGGNDTADSDLNLATSCTKVITLGTDENNPSLDIGLLPPLPAALGNFVWFDRNGDGVQNETPYDGTNGVTVRLYVDDGDGTSEPGGDDPQIAVTATANDVNNIPGYYRFDGLSADVPYFVQFDLPAGADSFTGLNQGGDDTMDSDAGTGGLSPMVVLSAGEYIDTLDAGLVINSANLSLGNQVWLETDNDGLFEPQNGETGINNVRLSLYKDINGDGQPSLDEYQGYTITYTANGLDGRYLFENLASGEDYFVVADLSNFSGDHVLAGMKSCAANDPAPDPDDDVNGDDNGGKIGANVGTLAVTLTNNGEPITDGDSDNNSNLTVDLCFTEEMVVSPVYDYGDAPDVLVGTDTLDYQTTALDEGAHHVIETGGPYLGGCVDADNGVFQDGQAQADDNSAFGFILGTCAIAGDDDDGVLFTDGTDPLLSAKAGDDLTIRVSSTPGCANLNAWIDWDGNGDFTDAGEQITTNDVSLTAGGQTDILIPIPSDQIPGPIYSRFRCSTEADLQPTGVAADGEVEDHVFYIIGTDYGDLPDSYTTLIASNGAVHDVDPRDVLMLGNCVDTEPDGQPTPAVNGDDDAVGTFTAGLCLDDEDGVSFDNNGELLVGLVNDITVIVNRTSRLDAWIDLNDDGDFGDAGEHIFSDIAINAGSNSLQFSIPPTVSRSATYTRFRVSSTGGLDSYGPASDGEVEDYAILLTENFLGDFVWNDLNDDGDYDTGEPGIEGVTIFIDLDGDRVMDPGEPSETTSSTGGYDFLGLPSGTYEVCVNTATAPYGFRMTYPGSNCYTVDLGPNEDYNDADFGYHQIDATLSNYVWYDTDMDGVQDPDEPGIAGVEVKLFAANDLTTELDSVATNGSGQYIFTGLSEGHYVVTFIEKSGYTITAQDSPSGNLGDTFDSDADPASGQTETIALAAGEQKVTVDAGMYLTDGSAPASLGNFVWFDSNEDGLQNPGENGVSGVTVTLREGAGILATTSSSGSGLYSFTGLPPGGDYVVCFTAPAGASFTLTDQGTDDALDSDATGTGNTRCSSTVALTAGEENLTIDAGFHLGGAASASLGNFVWFDADKDGIQDAGEPGIPSVTVHLNGSGGQIASTTTDDSGRYLFTGLVPGDYSVSIAVPPQAVISPQDIGGDDSSDSDIEMSSLQSETVSLNAGDVNLTLDAGVYINTPLTSALITIGDLVWFDDNHNHLPDSGEGILGVSLSLYDGAGVFLATTTTDADGLYLFSGLPPGNYRVKVDTSGLNPTYFQIGDPDGTYDSLTDLTNLNTDNLTADFGYGEPESDLELTKTVELTSDNDNNKKYSPKDEVTFTLTLINKGPSNAAQVAVKDELPNGYTYISSSASLGTYTPPFWSVGDLANGATVTLEIVAEILRKGDYDNTAQVTNSNLPDWDSVPSNDDGDQSEDDEARVSIKVKNFSWLNFIARLPKPTCQPVPDYCYLVADEDNEDSHNSSLFKYTFKTDTLELINRLGSEGEEAIIHSLDGRKVYTVAGDVFGTIDPTVGLINSFNPTDQTGIGWGRGSYGLIELSDVDGLSFDPITRILYGVVRYGEGNMGDHDLLITLEPNKGRLIQDAFGPGMDYVVIDSAATSGYDVDDIAIDSDGTLFGVVGNSGGGGGDHLIVIDKFTGATSDYGQLVQNGISVQDMESLTLYDPSKLYGATGTEFTARGTANTLYEIDKLSGECRAITRLDKNFDGYIPRDFEAISCFPICK